MPFDGENYKPEPKHDVFSLPALIAWLERQDPATEYDFMDCEGGCLIAQYLIATTGKLWTQLGFPASSGQSGWGTLIDTHPWASHVANADPNTMGAALQRARSLAERMDKGEGL